MNVAEKNVFVGLSGGVDSAVSALRLKAQGYNVTGVFIKVWHPDFLVCNWEAERLDAMRVAAHLDIDFLTCDATIVYRDEVAQYFIDEYKAGRTPNPDVLCNQRVKFGAFLRFAQDRGADFIATGHYAQKLEGEWGFELHRGADSGKDQSYFLWSLSAEQLKLALFPVGNSLKAQIRQEAIENNLPVATKKDSQGVCFLGHVDIPEFLSHYVELIPGRVIDESGATIGEHRGALVYTLGQRHGFTLHTEDSNRQPMYVVDRDLDDNTITVGPARLFLPAMTEIRLHSIVLRNFVKAGERLQAQYRYRQTPQTVKVVHFSDQEIILSNVDTTECPAPGQSCVLYRGGHCLGGGIIE